MNRRTLLLSSLATGAGIRPAAGQNGQPERPSSLLKSAFPRPTGQNGCEDLLAAADLLATSKLYRQTQEDAPPTGASLAQKRRALSDPPVTRALALVQRGLAKPYAPPVPAGAGEGEFSHLAPMRNLARLLMLRQYVLLADGRAADAIGMARMTMRLGTVVQAGSLITGLVGVAIHAIGIRPLGDHLDQLAARDCELLFQVCGEWLDQPSPLLRVLEAERRSSLKMFAEMVGQKPEPPTPDELDMLTPEQRRMLAGMTPDKVAAFRAEMLRRLDGHWERMLAESRKPYWERKLPDPGPADESPHPANLARMLAGLFSPVFQQAQDQYARVEAMVRLLAVHAAVLRHRWEWDRPPQDLAALNLGDLVVDPFTGQALLYQATGRRYRLSSAGPAAAADDPLAVDGRRPVTVER